MDARFLEFWGRALTDAAKGQRLLEDALKWMTQGMKGDPELLSLFRKAYGLDVAPTSMSDEDIWKQAQETFQKSAKEYLVLCGVVPIQDHLALLKKYEELKEKIACQEETIKHLRTLMQCRDSGQEELHKGFQELIRRQTDQFTELMRGFGVGSKGKTQSGK